MPHDVVLVHSANAGLCNRLIALACFAGYARRLGTTVGVPLIVWWTPGNECPGLPESGFDRESLYWKPVNEAAWVYQVRAAADPAVFAHDYTSAMPARFVPWAFANDAQAFVAVSVCLRGLRPAPDVAARLGRLPVGGVGIHVRRTDLTGDLNEARDNRLVARLDRQADDGEPWLVACDDSGTLWRLISRYGSRRIKHTGAVFRNDLGTRLTTVADSALDLLALARCRQILGTLGSTFSTAASLIGGGVLEMI